MKNKYTISELARFFNVSSQTLRYYDRIGLYQPAFVDRETGYRYYSYEQFFTLSLIIQLKKLNFSLKDIEKYINVKNISYLEEILENEQTIIEKQIEELDRLKEKNQSILNKIQLSRDVNRDSVIEIREEKERYEYQVSINFEIKDLYQYIKLMYESYLKGLSGKAGMGHNEVVLKINQRNLEQGKFRVYNSIGIFINQEDMNHQIGCNCIKAGTYATGYHVGSYDTIHHAYGRLYTYIKENGYRITGDSLEFAIISISLTDNKDEFITEIQIPVEKE